MATPNHGYEQPAPGSLDGTWGTTLNNIREQIDLDIPVVDTDANITTTNYAPDGQLAVAQDTGTVYYGNSAGPSWNAIGTVNVDGTAIAPQSVNNEVYASAFSGNDLSAKVVNALDALAGNQGRVRVTAKPDGTAWQWTQNVVIDAAARNGIVLDVDHNVEIEYGGTGWMLTVDNNWGASPTNQLQETHIIGGIWTATGDPQGWLKIMDGFGSRIYPHQVTFKGSLNSGIGVSVENHESYSERSHIGGEYDCDTGIRFVPASVTGGTGTDSFHDTNLDAPHINVNDYGLILQGRFDYCHVNNPALFAKADGAVCMQFNTERAEGTVITAPKCESPGTYVNTVAIEKGPVHSEFYGPMIVGGRLGGSGIDIVTSGFTDPIPWIRPYGKALQIHDPVQGSAIEFDGINMDAAAARLSDRLELTAFNGLVAHSGGGPVYFQQQGTDIFNYNGSRIRSEQPIQHAPKDVRAITGPAKGYTAYHDPSISADTNTEGPAFYNGTAWISQVDGSTIS